MRSASMRQVDATTADVSSSTRRTPRMDYARYSGVDGIQMGKRNKGIGRGDVFRAAVTGMVAPDLYEADTYLRVAKAKTAAYRAPRKAVRDVARDMVAVTPVRSSEGR